MSINSGKTDFWIAFVPFVGKRPYSFISTADSSRADLNNSADTSTVSAESDSGISENKRQRVLLTTQQREILKLAFSHVPYPTSGTTQYLAEQLGLSERTVVNFFHNRRMRLKGKPTSYSSASMVGSESNVVSLSNGEKLNCEDPEERVSSACSDVTKNLSHSNRESPAISESTANEIINGVCIRQIQGIPAGKIDEPFAVVMPSAPAEITGVSAIGSGVRGRRGRKPGRFEPSRSSHLSSTSTEVANADKPNSSKQSHVELRRHMVERLEQKVIGTDLDWDMSQKEEERAEAIAKLEKNLNTTVTEENEWEF